MPFNIVRLAALIGPFALLLLPSCEGPTSPGHVRVVFHWEEIPQQELAIAVRVEDRNGPSSEWRGLASSRATNWTPSTPFQMSLDSIPHGDNRVVVVEATPTGASSVHFYGISQPFSLTAGEDVTVVVPIGLHVPETERVPPSLALRFGSLVVPDPADPGHIPAVSPTDFHAATLAFSVSGAVRVVLDNDLGFSRQPLEFDLSDGALDCGPVDDDGRTACTYSGWDLAAGFAETPDGTYSVFAKFEDAQGYESQPVAASVRLDSRPPIMINASVAPPIAAIGTVVAVSVSFQEPLGKVPTLSIEPDGSGLASAFGPLEQVGETTTYVAQAVVPPGPALQSYSFRVAAEDALGNASEPVPLTDQTGTLTLTVDGKAPTLVDAPVLNASLFGLGGAPTTGHSQLEFDLRIRESLPPDFQGGACQAHCPQVLVDGLPFGEVIRTPALDDESLGVLAFSVSGAMDVSDWGPIQRDLTIDVRWTDAAGNAMDERLQQKLHVDFLPPSISTASAALTAPAGSLAQIVDGITDGTRVVVSLTTDEPLDHPPFLLASHDGVIVTLGQSQLVSGSTYRAETLIGELSADAPPQGEYELKTTLTDAAGNKKLVQLPLDPALIIDTEAPIAPETGLDAPFVLFRSPWGSADTDFLPAVEVRGGPGAVDPGSVVGVFARTTTTDVSGCDGKVLATGQAADDGSVAVELLGDAASVCVSQTDSAGNESIKVPVTTVEWVATLNGSTPEDDLSNPHRLLEAHMFHDALPTLGRATDITQSMKGVWAADDEETLTLHGRAPWMWTTGGGNLNYVRLGAAFDDRAGHVVMLAGQGPSAITNLLAHLTDKDDWTALPGTKGPQFRYGHDMAFDRERDRLVVFGGRKITGTIHWGDTWELDGYVWHEASPEHSPTPRGGHSMTYHAVMGGVVLFGGCGYIPQPGDKKVFEVNSDIWLWDGVDWLDVSPSSGPAARCEHAAAYDAVRRRLVVHGGMTGESMTVGPSPEFSDTWEWDGVSWTQMQAQGPMGTRALHDMAYDRVGQRTILFGGVGEATEDKWEGIGTTWAWDGVSWKALPPTPKAPAPRFGHRMVWDEVRSRIVLVGGWADMANQPLQAAAWSNGEWSGLPTFSGLTANDDFELAYDVAASRLLAVNTDQSETLTYDPGGVGWSSMGAAGLPTLSEFALAWDPAAKATVLYGGRTPQDGWDFGDTVDQVYHWKSGKWNAEGAGPDARHGHQMVHDGTRLLVFGGQNISLKTGFWARENGSWQSLTPQTLPPLRRDHAMAANPQTGEVLLFGGAKDAGISNCTVGLFADTWLFDGSDWVELDPEHSPPGRTRHSMIYDSARNTFVLFGGGDGCEGGYSDAWEWDGVDWSIHPDGLSGFGGKRSSAAFEPALGEAFVAQKGLHRHAASRARPQVIASFDLGSSHTIIPSLADPIVKQLLSAGIRVRAGGTAMDDSGAAVSGVELFARSRIGPAWTPLGVLADADPSSLDWFELEAPADWSCPSSKSCQFSAPSTWVDGNHRVNVLARPLATAGAANSILGLDYVELRLRYARGPVCEPGTTCCKEDGTWAAPGTVCDDGDPASLNDGCSAGACVGCTPSCDGKECGNDGCGGTCGSCSAADPGCALAECNADGLCDISPLPEGTPCGASTVCSTGECDGAGVCLDQPAEPTTIFFDNFDQGWKWDSQPESSCRWLLYPAGKVKSKPNALYYGNPTKKNYVCGPYKGGGVQSPWITLPDSVGVSLSFYVYADIMANPSIDQFTGSVVTITPAGKALAEGVVDKFDLFPLGTWHAVSVDLTAWAGKKVILEFYFNTGPFSGGGGGEGIYIDDLTVSADCD